MNTILKEFCIENLKYISQSTKIEKKQVSLTSNQR